MVRVVGDCSGHCGVRSARRLIIGSAHMVLTCCESPVRVEHVVVFFLSFLTYRYACIAFTMDDDAFVQVQHQLQKHALCETGVCCVSAAVRRTTNPTDRRGTCSHDRVLLCIW